MSLTSVDPFGDKRRKESAKTMAKLKKGAKTAKKIRTKPIKISIQSASITTPKGMSIEKNTIMPKMAKEGGLMTQGNLRDAIAKVKAKEMEAGGEAVGATKGLKEAADKLAKVGRVRKAKEERKKKEEELRKKFKPDVERMRKDEKKQYLSGLTKSGEETKQLGRPPGSKKKGQLSFRLGTGTSRLRKNLPRGDITQKLKLGGEAVPAKFKGFSKLPEEVQKKMDPALAERFEDGGPVKMGSGGGVCKGMGIARAGGKFKIR